MFIIGDDIIYWDKNGSQWPGKIIAIKTAMWARESKTWPRCKVQINHLYGDKTIWVKPINLTHQG